VSLEVVIEEPSDMGS